MLYYNCHKVPREEGSEMKKFECVCGLGFGSVYPRRDTVKVFTVESSSARGAKMKAKREYKTFLFEHGWSPDPDVYGFVCDVKEI